MAITLLKTSHEGTDEIYGVGAGERERTYIVRCNHPSDNADGLYESGLLPFLGSTLNGNIMMTLRPPVTIVRQAKFIFKVSCRWSSRNETPQEREQRLIELSPIPWYRPPTITCPVNEYSDEPDKDVFGDAVINSFGTPFSSVKPRRRWRPIIRVVQPVQSIPSWYYALAGFRNSGPVTVVRRTGPLPTFPDGTLLFVPGDIGESRQSGPYIYDELQFELHYDEDGHNWEPIDMGPYYKLANGQTAKFHDGMGFLNLAGGAAANQSNPSTLFFVYYKKASFAALPLNQWG